MIKRNFKNWLLLCLLICAFPLGSRAQILSATVGVSGLTCSQCSRSVEMALRKLDFVSNVKMNLEQTTGTVYFKPNRDVDWEQLAQAPRNAGFSTSFVNIKIDFSKIETGGNCFIFQGKAFYFLQPLITPQPNVLTFQIIQKGFLPKTHLEEFSLKPSGLCSASKNYFLKAVKG